MKIEMMQDILSLVGAASEGSEVPMKDVLSVIFAFNIANEEPSQGPIPKELEVGINLLMTLNTLAPDHNAYPFAKEVAKLYLGRHDPKSITPQQAALFMEIIKGHLNGSDRK